MLQASTGAHQGTRICCCSKPVQPQEALLQLGVHLAHRSMSFRRQ